MKSCSYLTSLLLTTLGLFPVVCWSVPGVTGSEIVFGSILPLNGRAEVLGKGMQAGLDHSLVGLPVGQRSVWIMYLNDLYEPALSPIKVRKLNRKGIFSMIGNVGTLRGSKHKKMI